ncbi:prepilin-type N-terminal cleavage/methylation domain-containing protein [Cellvibrio mixtus]|uniref:prepilin-type N-terminal cleavage/methylation domain-containing protein n=1 Tax=Cellvibrio mixtus TaxID=39650 RepID=UPI000586CE2E|nr:prepilin-type N-terminal cleavage/methylation domain-containing protein [Cellvibrio mixtus]
MKQQGVTLVELMIVLLIIGLIAVAASPFTSAWVKDAKVSEGASAVEEAIGRAKAAALRNTARVTGDKPASRVCFSSSEVKVVVPATPTQEVKCDLTPVWTAKLSDVVTVKTFKDKDDTPSTWSCSCFNNKGLAITDSANCNECSTNLNFKFGHTGVDSDERSFY